MRPLPDVADTVVATETVERPAAEADQASTSVRVQRPLGLALVAILVDQQLRPS